MALITPPFATFFDVDGAPLEDGFIYIGLSGQNPLIQANQVQIYSDSALSVPVNQPVKTSGGYPVAGGTPIKLYTTLNDYSILILNKNQVLVYASLSNNTLIGFPQTKPEQAASVVPVNNLYPPGHLYRYGTNVTPGTTDMTAALTTALSVQQDVFVPDEIQKISAAVNMLSNQTIYGLGPDSQIFCTGVAINAINITGKTRAIVRDLFVKYTGTAATGFDGNAVFISGGSSFCTVQRCRLEGVRGGVTINGGNDNVVDDNDVTNVTLGATLTEGSWDIAVYLAGSRNRVTRNRCFGGSGIGIQLISDTTHNVDRNIVTNNMISSHIMYGINVYASGAPGTTNNNVVSDNNIWDITGTAVSGGVQPFGAGIYIQSAEWTTVTGNVIENTNVSTNTLSLAPGGIGLNGVSCFVVANNIIKAPKWHGIYIVNDGNLLGGGIIEGNTITSPVKTGLTILNMSVVTAIGNSMLGGTTDNGIRIDHSGTATGIRLQGNIVKSFAAGSGITINNAQSPNVTGNYLHTCQTGMQFTTVNGGSISNNEIRNTSGGNDIFIDGTCTGFIHFDRNTVRSAAANGVTDLLGLVYGTNDVAGQTTSYVGVGLERTLATSATPDVRGSNQAKYGAATAVTDLLNPFPGQRITIRATAACTFQHNTGAATTKMILQGAINFVMALDNTLTLEYVSGGPWYEVGRKL